MSFVAVVVQADMSSIKIRSQILGDDAELRLLITHPMENGRNRDYITGELIAAHFITELTISVNASKVIQVNLTGSMAKNPFFTFQLKNTGIADKISVAWLDNQQFSDHAEHIIA